MGPLGSHSESSPPHWCLASPPTWQMGANIISFSTAKLRKHASFNIPRPQAFLCFPEGAWESQLRKLRQEGGRGEG